MAAAAGGPIAGRLRAYTQPGLGHVPAYGRSNFLLLFLFLILSFGFSLRQELLAVSSLINTAKENKLKTKSWRSSTYQRSKSNLPKGEP